MNLLMVGNPAIDFTLPDQDGKQIKISDLKGSKIVLYFYPKDDTPGCTIEAKDFATADVEFAKLDTKIIGISKDNLKSHVKFREKYCLPFTLLSDNESDVCEKYGVWVEKSMYGKKYMGIERTTFLIDENGIVRQIWPKVSVSDHVKEVLEAVKNLGA